MVLKKRPIHRKKCKCNLFTNEALRSSQELIHEMFVHSRIELEFGNVGF